MGKDEKEKCKPCGRVRIKVRHKPEPEEPDCGRKNVNSATSFELVEGDQVKSSTEHEHGNRPLNQRSEGLTKPQQILGRSIGCCRPPD